LSFLPLNDSRVAQFTDSFSIQDNVNNYDYNIRVYGQDSGDAVILVAPSPLGSVFIVDRICDSLSSRGFTVLAFSRSGLDLPSNVANAGAARDTVLTYNKYKFPQFNVIKQYLANIFRIGRIGGDARFFEAERKHDIEFLLPLISSRYNSKVFILSYDTAASAALLLSGNNDFIKANPALTGIIAVEPRLHSSYSSASAAEAVSEASESASQSKFPGANFFSRIWQSAGSIVRKYDAPERAEIDPPLVPIFLVNSDRINQEIYAEREYSAPLAFFNNNKSMVRSGYIDGAGPFDYSDVPELYPLFSFLSQGVAARTMSAEECVNASVKLFTDFMADAMSGSM
jgi:hypothetical protein